MNIDIAAKIKNSHFIFGFNINSSLISLIE